jgi:outer membrane protein assembly factor BamA
MTSLPWSLAALSLGLVLSGCATLRPAANPAANPAAAESPIATEPAADDEATPDPPPRRHTLLPLPVVFYTPETRWAGGAAALHSFRPAPGARPTVTAANGVYTQNRQVSVELQTDGYLRGDAYSVSGGIGHARFPERFFGIGNETRAEDEETFTSRGTRADLTVRRRIAPGIYLGGRYEVRRMEILEREPDGLLAGGGVRGADGGGVAGAGLSLTRDTRDDVLFPTSGSFHTAAALRTGGPLGGDFRLTRYTVDLRRYFPVAGQVLGVQGYARAVTGDVPFTMLPQLGGQNLMRGTLASRYRDRTVVAAQAEYRVQLWRRLGGVVFAGAGQVAERPGDVALAEFHPSLGYGLRFRLDPRDRLNLRLDFGYGRGGAGGLYITAGEAF